MKKLALFMLLAVSAPMFAIISDAEYAEIVEMTKRHTKEYAVRSGLSEERAYATAAAFVDSEIATPNDALIFFAKRANLPAVEYLIMRKGANPNYINPDGVSVLRASQFWPNQPGVAEVVEFLKRQGAQ